jgi:hypothetical protein
MIVHPPLERHESRRAEARAYAEKPVDDERFGARAKEILTLVR